jgi:hypothetical protein
MSVRFYDCLAYDILCTSLFFIFKRKSHAISSKYMTKCMKNILSMKPLAWTGLQILLQIIACFTTIFQIRYSMHV